MMNELDALESKIAQAALLCNMLRAENSRLRQELFVVQNERKELTERMTSARQRIESLVSRSPEAQSD